MPEILGDAMFNRLDMRTDPASLPPGTVRVSQNFRFDTDGARVRAGIARQFPPGLSVETLRFAGVYRPDNSNDRIALVTHRSLTLFNPADQSTERYDFPAAEFVSESDPVDLVQAGISAGTTPDLYILRGFAKDALKFDGSAVALAPNFERGEFGLFTQDRILLNSTAQAVSASDFLDFETWTLLNQFQILKGSDDYLIGLHPYQKDFVIISTRKRFFVAYLAPSIGAEGYDGNLNVRDSFLRDLTREAGPVSRRAVLEAGGLIWFISDNGIYTFQPRLDLELTVLDKPISADIQPVFDRLSANYAGGASIQRLGHHLYFAMPVNPEPVAVVTITVNAVTGVLELPFTLPAVLTGTANIATVETASAHGMAAGATVQITGGLDAGLNGTFTVLGAPDVTHFTYATAADASTAAGERVTLHEIVSRPNRIAVFNLANGGWESVDVLPPGVFADYLLVADHGARRRLWLVDRDLGPALYEEGDVDEISDATGGLRLPFTLPGQFTVANFEAVPIAGRLLSRTLRWGGFVRHVRAGAARISTSTGDSGTFTVTVRTPDRGEWVSSRVFDDTNADTEARKRCGKRGLEAELEVVTLGGRPTVRSLTVENTASGRTAEE